MTYPDPGPMLLASFIRGAVSRGDAVEARALGAQLVVPLEELLRNDLAAGQGVVEFLGSFAADRDLMAAVATEVFVGVAARAVEAARAGMARPQLLVGAGS